jgi:hypothetical protein
LTNQHVWTGRAVVLARHLAPALSRVFAINEGDRAAADEYEADEYRRVAVPLRSGDEAWVYVFASSMS